MKQIRLLLSVSLACYTLTANAQFGKSDFVLNGYVTNMQSVMFDSIGNNWVNDNLIHNRLNFKWYPHSSTTVVIEARNRIFTGETVKYSPGYAKSLDADNGWVDLSTNLASEQSVIMNSAIDRAYVETVLGDFTATVGRQRINWGRSFVWNANDIFNTYSFFDFDYAERPGTDALRLQYYPSLATTVEFAANVDSADLVTAAALVKFNVLGYDWQFIAGSLKEEDWVAGFGFEGNIKSVAIRGEASYFHPQENAADTSGMWLASVSFDYSFESQLFVQTEFLFANLPDTGEAGSFMEFYAGPMSVKKMSFTEFSWFAQASYPINPLLSLSVSGMYYPGISGYYAGPSVSFSLKDNLDFSVFAQTFSGELTKDQRDIFNFAFLRMKYSF